MVSAELGQFQKLEGTSNKGRATSLQRVLVPWLISKYGMLYKNARMVIVMQMVEAIIDRDNLLDLRVQCHHGIMMVRRLMRSDSILSSKRPSRQQACVL